MKNDLRATDRKGKGIQRPTAFEYPIIPNVRLQQLAGLVKFEILLNHATNIPLSCLLIDLI